MTDKCREEFEKWWKMQYPDMPYNDLFVGNKVTDDRWLIWQAAWERRYTKSKIKTIVKALQCFDESMRASCFGENGEKNKARLMKGAHRKAKRALALYSEEK